MGSHGNQGARQRGKPKHGTQWLSDAANSENTHAVSPARGKPKWWACACLRGTEEEEDVEGEAAFRKAIELRNEHRHDESVYMMSI